MDNTNINLAWLMAARPGDRLAELHAKGTLSETLPEVEKLYGVPQNALHHPEVCTGAHIELCLNQAARDELDFAARFAVLTHDLGKGLTPAQEWPRHLDHENRGLPSVKDVCARAGVDKAVEALALDVCKWHLTVHRALEMRSTSLLRFLEKTGLEGDPLLRERFIGACRADALGRLGKGDKPYFQAALLREACIALKELPSLGREAMNTREGQERHVLRLNKFRPIRAHYVQLHAGHKERATLD